MSRWDELMLWELSDQDVQPFLEQIRTSPDPPGSPRVRDLLRLLALVAPRARSVWDALAEQHAVLGQPVVAEQIRVIGRILSSGEEMT